MVAYKPRREASETSPFNTLTSDFWSPEHEKVNVVFNYLFVKAAQANLIPSCSTELYRKDTLQMQLLESTPFFTPTVTFFLKAQVLTHMVPITVVNWIQPSKDVHVLMPEPENISPYMVRGLCRYNWGGSWGREIILAYPGSCSVMTRVFPRRWQGQVSSKRCDDRSKRLEWGNRGFTSQEMWMNFRSRERQGHSLSPLSPLRVPALLTPWL